MNILESPKFVELKKMKKKNRELIKVFKTGNLDYHKLMMVGLKPTGLDECGSDNMFKYGNMKKLKEINWRRMGDDLGLIDNKRKRYDIVMSSFENYLPFDLEFKKEINKTVSDTVGNDMIIINLIIRNSIFIIEEKYNFSLLRHPLDLEGQVCFDDLFLIEQLYDELLDITHGFENLAKNTIKHNSAISNKLKDEISIYLLAEMI